MKKNKKQHLTEDDKNVKSQNPTKAFVWQKHRKLSQKHGENGQEPENDRSA